jgi:hypothetical protein
VTGVNDFITSMSPTVSPAAAVSPTSLAWGRAKACDRMFRAAEKRGVTGIGILDSAVKAIF